jgi:hypothetical protein
MPALCQWAWIGGVVGLGLLLCFKRKTRRHPSTQYVYMVKSWSIILSWQINNSLYFYFMCVIGKSLV